MRFGDPRKHAPAWSRKATPEAAAAGGPVPVTITHVDLALDPLREADPTHIPEPVRRGLFVAGPERRLMADVLAQAIEESQLVSGANAHLQPSARAWLREQPGFTARECCEALGIDYEVMMRAMEKKWSAQPVSNFAAQCGPTAPLREYKDGDVNDI